jgi:2,4-dienoyl-CoA reductase-like NADH-dependent reductase (Old Yellow Enzyme family)
MNLRSDGWGGSLEGRARLLRQTVQAIRAVVPDSFVVGVRISPEDFGQARGLDLDESVQVGRWLVEDQIDYLHLSLWNVAHNSRKYPDRHPIDLFRAAVADSVKLVVAGSIWTVADAEAQLDRGADIVSLGRAAIANPDWPQRAADPSFVPRRPPLDPAELAALDVGPTFVSYLRRFRDFVK